jgi:hypothetical protein
MASLAGPRPGMAATDPVPSALPLGQTVPGVLGEEAIGVFGRVPDLRPAWRQGRCCPGMRKRGGKDEDSGGKYGNSFSVRA